MSDTDIDPETDRVWNNLCSRPGNVTGTLTLKQLRAFLLRTDGWIMAWGRIWDIRSKRLGPGVYRVWVEVRE